MNATKKSDLLHVEAENLLKKTGIVKILSKYGKPFSTGSYSYDLMTWRDIDFCLMTSQPSAVNMLKIGSELARIPNIATMYFRNEHVLKTKRNPKGMFWCIEFLFGKKTWKVDILVSEKKVIENVLKPGMEILKKLTPEKRKHILAIKSILSKDSRYRKDFRSTDVYEAVLKHNITSFSEWSDWWKKKQQK